VEYNLDKDRRWVLGALKEMPLGCVRHWEKIYKLYSEFRSQKPEGKTLKHIKELTAACDLAHPPRRIGPYTLHPCIAETTTNN